MANRAEERNQDATVYVGNIDERFTETLLWELMLQTGRVVNVYLPKDRVTQSHQGYGFVEYQTEEEADYSIKIMNMIKIFGKPLRVNKATSDKKNLDVGATLFIGNLDPDVDEKLLYDTFSAFGVIIQTPKIARDPDTGNSKGYAFVSFDNFDSSDAAIEAMNSQFLMNKSITASYAFKKDGKGERHGSAAERLLAAQARKNEPTQMPNRFFADIPGANPAATAPSITPAPPMPMPGMMGAPVLPGQALPPPMGQPMMMGATPTIPPPYMGQPMMPPQQSYPPYGTQPGYARPPMPQAPFQYRPQPSWGQ
ncbi:uncharacterized protein BJ171DRAFT_524429 [Polychytrium aggregatum]|uniref:uncharacterized protein n=1 Tax=Polychytrium aggregatum TaxID=110093 RepID=UPI0022FEF0CA|nr:uncharacterized protein BJ171DRAFT_524429 [Polychytrium aggregatum]KAI9193750.1 hypothetical protein BJ171DRAFT_524429 [Polychytrium aggregatum]